MKILVRPCLWLSCLLTLGSPMLAQSAMERDFLHPPDSAKPRVWWHWLSGNVTQEGITADLEWMQRVGIGGFQMFDGDLSTPRFVDRPLIWMTPEWKAAWHHTAAEAERLNLDMGMAASGGWSETAGPWVQPQQGMKKYVWSETVITGPAPVHTRLAQPPSTVGKFQTMPTAPDMAFPTPTDLPGTKPPIPSPALPPTAPFYRDVQVVAYKLPIDDVAPAPNITTSSTTPMDLASLDGHDLGKTTLLRIPAAAKEGWIEFHYPQPVTTYAMTIGVGVAGGFLAPQLPSGVLEVSDDGKHWSPLVALPGSAQSPSGAITLRTYAYEATKASFYRLRVSAPILAGAALALGAPAPPGVTLSELVLHTSPRVNHWEDKAAFGIFIADKTSPTPQSAPNTAIAPENVIDLTSSMQPDGTLDWRAPPGKWVVLRFGYGLTGERNHPATPAATGLEVDKLSREDVASYTKTYTGMISAMAGDLYGKSFRNFVMDSWEAGNENWTERMADEFQKRRGYSLTPYLPVLTGRVVGSAANSDAFLWDFRRTMAEMLAENHYGTFAAAVKPSGIALYSEAMGTDLPTNGDGLLNKGNVTVPMGEFWTPAPSERDLPSHIADTREAASAAHIYGKPIAATESFTTTIGMPGWAQSPFYLKPLADENFARGINRIIIHTSDHQPFTDDAHKPGLTLGPFGQNYTRNITWAEQAVAWNTYLARVSYLLQQGSYVADVAYFVGEGSPSVVPFWKPIVPAPPTHYGFDYLNSDVLLYHSRVQDGRLRLDSGMSYKLLVFQADTHQMTVELLRKLYDLVSNGATLLAPKPDASPSLADGAASTEFTSLTDTLWGSTPIGTEGRTVGKGRVFDHGDVEPLLAHLSIAPDLTYTPPTALGAKIGHMPIGDSDQDLVYIHRHLAHGEIYFLATQKLQSFETSVTFRVGGKRPSAWNPLTGERSAVSYRVRNGATTIPLHFNADGSTLIVFDAAPPRPEETVAPRTVTPLQDLSSGWTLKFPKAPNQVAENSLRSWTDSPDPAIKYFSGTATYRKVVTLQPSQLSGDLSLDLGDVREIAEVTLNGTRLNQILWTPPYRINTNHLLHAGQNTIEVLVTNLWPNRLIGDQQPGATQHTFTGIHAYSKDSPLFPSGLLGPVTLLQSK